MDVDRILALADIIESQPHTAPESPDGFTMECYVHECGTPACIAGWAVEAFGDEEMKRLQADKDILFDPYQVAKKLLVLSWSQAGDLFHPHKEETSRRAYWATLTPTQAAATLRHLAKTGDVIWE